MHVIVDLIALLLHISLTLYLASPFTILPIDLELSQQISTVIPNYAHHFKLTSWPSHEQSSGHRYLFHFELK
jgi:hypothetical protein